MEYKIRELRKRRKMNQTELAKEVGASLRQMSYWENGKGLSIEDAGKLADFFGVSIDVLVGHEQEERCSDNTKQSILDNYELLNDQGRKQLALQAQMMASTEVFIKP